VLGLSRWPKNQAEPRLPTTTKVEAGARASTYPHRWRSQEELSRIDQMGHAWPISEPMISPSSPRETKSSTRLYPLQRGQLPRQIGPNRNRQARPKSYSRARLWRNREAEIVIARPVEDFAVKECKRVPR
jgi:hypothetical protein